MSGSSSSAGPRLPPPPDPFWELADAPDPAGVERLRAVLDLPAPLCALLAVRGHGDPDQARAYLRPLLDHLHSPMLLADMDVAVGRLQKALDAGETILVHGDYDVDGVCAAALYTRWLRFLGGRVEPFVPHRLRDGYDLGDAGVDRALEVGAGVILTADSGVSAGAAVARAREAGLDVLVTDHHAPPEELPPATAVVNPNREDCPYPDGALSGAGVAFKVCQALGESVGADPDALLPYLDLVALATVADLVPLRGENRALVRYGLRALRSTRNPGLRALLEVTGLDGKEVEAGHVGFVVGPRINAMGRMGDAGRALRLLVTDDPAEARALAEEMDEQNRIRRDEDRRTLDQALELLSRSYDPERDYGVVVAREGWHPGVIGIVASRVVERIHRPVVLVALDGDGGRGSARSVPGFDLHGAVKACASHLERFGGHPQAAGMDIRADRVEGFREDFNRVAREALAGTDLRPVIRADLELSIPEISPELYRYLRYVGPFGIGNRRPVFLTRGARLSGSPRVVGDGHLKLTLEQDGARLPAIGFRLARRVPPTALTEPLVDVAYQLQENEYRGRVELQARLLDIRPAGPATEGGA